MSIPVRAAATASSVEREIWPHLGGPIERCQVLDTSATAGTVLGATRTGKLVRVQLLRPVPARIVVVDHAWLASLLALRAAVLGAHTAIVTDRPAPWTALTASVGGTTAFAAVIPRSGASQLPPPSVMAPLFVLWDGGAPEVESRDPWFTAVHLLHRLDAQATAFVDSADLILVPRPADEQIQPLLDILRLPQAMAGKVAAMERTEVLAVTRARALFVTVSASPTEQQILGAR